MRKIALRGGFGVLIGATLLFSVAAQASGEMSIFARLSVLEERATVARRVAGHTEAEAGQTDDRIEELASEMSVASRAAKPIRQQIAQAMKVWIGALNATGKGSWEQRDTTYLLGYAAPRALRPKLSNVHLLDLADSHQATLSYAVGVRAMLSVQLAQAKADADSADETRREVLESAGSNSSVKRDLARTEEAMLESIKGMARGGDGIDFHRYKGTLHQPVAGRPDVGFGPRAFGFKDVTTRHSGLTWKIPAGAEVKATGGGVVVFAQTFEGYGNVVIVDHGGGYHSLYAHLSKPSVATGTRVERGHVLGISGDTGSLEGPKLYFELRHDGKPIDPVPWFVTR